MPFEIKSFEHELVFVCFIQCSNRTVLLLRRACDERRFNRNWVCEHVRNVWNGYGNCSRRDRKRFLEGWISFGHEKCVLYDRREKANGRASWKCDLLSHLLLSNYTSTNYNHFSILKTTRFKYEGGMIKVSSDAPLCETCLGDFWKLIIIII
jgi:hypothetical protein